MHVPNEDRVNPRSDCAHERGATIGGQAIPITPDVVRTATQSVTVQEARSHLVAGDR